MKIRRGFVTNSSSTNDIFQALGTAGAAAALGTILNVQQPAKNIQIISYALLETTHQPEEPRPPVVRVNDNSYVAWYYAGVRMIDVQFVTKEKTGEVETTVLRDEYDATYTSQIIFGISPEVADKWLVFGTSGTEEGGEPCYATMDGDFKVCGFMCMSPANDSPRRMRPSPPGLLEFEVSVTVNEKKLSKLKKVKFRDESDLYLSGGYALNDSSVPTEFSIAIMNKDRYHWDLTYDVSNKKFEEFADITIEKATGSDASEGSLYNLVVRPRGTELGTKENPSNQLMSRVDVVGKPNAGHIVNIWDYANITLVQEGLIFEGETDSEGCLVVRSYAKEEEEGSEPAAIPPVLLKLSCVVRNDEKNDRSTAKFIDMKAANVEIGDLEGTDNATENLVKAYKYKIEKKGVGSYQINPLMQLPSSKTPYAVTLPVECNYEGNTYNLDIRIKLYGEPNSNRQAWEEEYKNLRITIRKYVPQEQWYDILKNINDNKNRLSIEQLRLMRKSIWETARDQLVAEARDYQNIATICDWTGFGFECVKWVNDQAFSYVATALFGPLVEAFLTPFKDVMFNLLGEYSVDVIWGSGGQLENEIVAKGSLAGIFSGFENVLMNGAGDNTTLGALDVKTVGKYLAAFAAVKCMNHYFCDTKPDGSPVGLWDAIIDTCKDLTVNLFKTLVSKKFEAIAKTPEAKEFYTKYAMGQVKSVLTKLYPDWEEKGIEILSKYLSEFGGLLSCAAYGKTIEVAGTGDIKASETDITITFNLSSNPDKPILVTFSFNGMKNSLYDYIFNCMFKNFPFAPNKLELTSDPTFYKK